MESKQAGVESRLNMTMTGEKGGRTRNKSEGKEERKKLKFIPNQEIRKTP